MKDAFKKRLLRRAIESLRLPPEIDLSIPKLVMNGNGELIVENHKGVLAYTMEEARFLTEEGVVCVRGTDMELYEFSPERASLRGRINGWRYEDRT